MNSLFAQNNGWWWYAEFANLTIKITTQRCRNDQQQRHARRFDPLPGNDRHDRMPTSTVKTAINATMASPRASKTARPTNERLSTMCPPDPSITRVIRSTCGTDAACHAVNAPQASVELTHASQTRPTREKPVVFRIKLTDAEVVLQFLGRKFRADILLPPAMPALGMAAVNTPVVMRKGNGVVKEQARRAGSGGTWQPEDHHSGEEKCYRMIIASKQLSVSATGGCMLSMIARWFDWCAKIAFSVLPLHGNRFAPHFSALVLVGI